MRNGMKRNHAEYVAALNLEITMNTWIKSIILAVAVTGLAAGVALPALAAPTFESITASATSDLPVFNLGASRFSANNSGTYFEGNAGLAAEAILGSHIQSSSDLNVHAHLSTQRIPEPDTYAMMLAGLGLMGVVARRRKQLEELV